MSTLDDRVLEPARRWWQEREPRERRMLGLMFAAIGGFVLWVGVVMPLQRVRDEALANRDRAANELREVVAAIGRIEALQSRQPATPTGDAFARTILDAAVAAEVPVSRQRLDDAGILTVGIDAVAAPALLGWLGGLQREHGIAPTTLDIAERNGRLQVQVGFRSPSP